MWRHLVAADQRGSLRFWRCRMASPHTMPLVGRARGSTRNRSSGACWQVQAIQPAHPDVIAIDGTTHRRSHDRPNGKAALHLVSAWAAEHRLAPGHIAVDDKSNAITAIPQLRDLLDCAAVRSQSLRWGRRRQLPNDIQRGSQEVSALEERRPTMAAEAATLCAEARTARQSACGMQTNRAVTEKYGRMETRQAAVIHGSVGLSERAATVGAVVGCGLGGGRAHGTG